MKTGDSDDEDEKENHDHSLLTPLLFADKMM